MILILEDDADREAYQRGNPFNPEFSYDANMRHPTVWISPEAYRKETVLDGLRAKAHALVDDPPESIRDDEELVAALLALLGDTDD